MLDIPHDCGRQANCKSCTYVLKVLYQYSPTFFRRRREIWLEIERQESSITYLLSKGI
jgi:hypothetical protein